MLSPVIEELPFSHLAEGAYPDSSIVHFPIRDVFIGFLCEEVPTDYAFDWMQKLALLVFQLGWLGENFLDDPGDKSGLKRLSFLDFDALDDPEGASFVKVVHSQ